MLLTSSDHIYDNTSRGDWVILVIEIKNVFFFDIKTYKSLARLKVHIFMSMLLRRPSR